jgi:MerR family transcriptional regulator, glutamine synthetase repressor
MDLNARRHLPLFSIGMVQKLTGLTARQIRYYEQHGLVQPARSEGNQRLFSFVDVERLMEVRRLLDDGLNMNDVKQVMSGESSGRTTVKPQNEPTDEEVYEWVQKELLEGPANRTFSEFQGDLSRFYRRK